MKNVFLILGILMCHLTILGQEPDWQHSIQWRLYNIDGNRGLRIRRDSLAYFKFSTISDDTVHYYFEGLVQWPKGKTAMWMGAYYASCVIDGKLHKINFSMHGGYFYDEQLKAYFQIPVYKREKFEEWLASLKLL